MTSTSTHSLTVAGLGPVEVTIDEQGEGPVFLLLHGGGGPQTVAGFAALLATTPGARVIVPIHPGFAGTARPEGLSTPAGIAAVYQELLKALDLRDVTVVGNSIGGWIGAELALLESSRISSLIVVNGIGIEVPGEPVADIFPLTPAQLSQLSFHDPAAFAIDVAALPPAQQAAMAANRAALTIYFADSTDPTLRERLAGVAVPALVLWGESDQVVTPGYGRAFAAAIPGARFQLLAATGHVPQIETPQQLLTAVREFAAHHTGRPVETH